jgi:hypothetical protein
MGLYDKYLKMMKYSFIRPNFLSLFPYYLQFSLRSSPALEPMLLQTIVLSTFVVHQRVVTSRSTTASHAPRRSSHDSLWRLWRQKALSLHHLNECNEQVSCFSVACFKKYNCYRQAVWMRTTPTVSANSEKVAGVWPVDC